MDHIKVSKQQVAAIQQSIGQEQIESMAMGLATAASHPPFMAVVLSCSMLCVTDGSTGNSVLVAINQRTWERLLKLMAAHGHLTQDGE